MRDTLKKFTTGSLEKASGALLEKLGVKYTSLVEGVPFDRYFEQNDFSYQYVEEVQKTIEHIWHIGYVNDTTFQQDIAQGEIVNNGYDTLSIFACEIKPEVNFPRGLAVDLTRAFNRVSTRTVNFNYDMPVVVIIRQGSLLSIATCERSDRADGLGERVGKVTILRNMDCENLHAGHRQILERIAKDVSGSSSYEELHEKWFTSFSIDVLSDKFFEGYKAIYEDIIEYVTGKRMVKDGNRWIERNNGEPCKKIMSEFSAFSDPEKAVRDYVKNLMGRLVFIQFLQKKGWMGVPEGDSWEGGDKDFLQNLFEKSDKKETFIDDVLEPLFNDLNTKRHRDLVTNQNVGHNIKVPYLNGGLFELDESDDTKFPLPAKFMKKLLDFFASYNFTIDENAPDDVEIGVDPEMLGRIFENLLEDNKDKGAFYTPKEIVQYMCRESLIAYLTTRVMKKQGENHKPEEDIRNAVRKLLSEPENIVPKMTPEHLSDFGTYIREVKICDPAVGSGAFPMGLLNELVRCRIIINAWARDAYGHPLIGNLAALKAEIIRNNIYGVDIEKGAIDIARLRFWLSIIVDEKSPEALPNFDYKFMQGNSLIPTFSDQYINLSTKNQTHKNVEKMKDVKRKILKFKRDFYSSSGEEKLNLNVLIKDHILQLISLQLGYEIESWEDAHAEQLSIKFNDFKEYTVKDIISQLPEDRRRIIELCKNLRERLADKKISLERRSQTDIQFFDWRMMFTEVFDVEDGKGGFDIVIGNPPYINIANLKDDALRKLYQKKFKTVKNKIDLYSLFTEKAYELLKNDGTCSYIFSNSWMGTDSFSLFRHFLIDETKILNLVDLPDKVFKNATVRTCIILFSKCIVPNQKIALIKYDGKLFNNLNETLSYEEVRKYEHYPFSFEKGINLERVHSVKLKDIATFTLGIKTSNDKRFISHRPYPEDSYKLIRGRNLQRYNTPIAAEWIWYRPDLFMEKTGAGPRRLEYFLTEKKIVIQDVAQEICATIDYNKNLCNDTINVIYHLKEEYQFEYVLGIMNSKLIRFWHKKLFPEGLHIKKYQLEVIPIPVVSEDIQSSIVSIVKTILSRKKNDPNAKTDNLELKLDRIIYELYGLTNGEVKMIDPEESCIGSDNELFRE